MQELSAAVFRRGGQKRELFSGDNEAAPAGGAAEEAEDEGGADEEVLTLQELQKILSAPRSGKDYSAAIWRPQLAAAELVKVRKGTAECNGYNWRKKHFLHIEEAVFFVDRGDLILFVEHQGQQRLLSVQEAYDLMVASGVELQRYLVYSQLTRSGYLVMRHPSRWALESAEVPARCWSSWSQGVKGATGAGDSGCSAAPAPEAGTAGHGQLEAQGLGAECAPVHSMECDTSPLQVCRDDSLVPGLQLPGSSGAHMPGEGAARQRMLPGSLGVSSGHAAAAAAIPASFPGQRQQQAPEIAQQQQQQQQQQPVDQAQQQQRVHRGWWRAADPQHPQLQGVPSTWFDQAPRNAVQSMSAELKQRHPRLKPLGAIADRDPHPQPDAPRVEPRAEGSSLSQSSRSSLVFDVYKPGSKVNRNKQLYPTAMCHLALCIDTPPSLQELRDAERQVQAAGAAAPAPVVWVSVENAILTFFQMGHADLLPLL